MLDLADLHELVGSYERSLELYRCVRTEAGGVRSISGMAGVLRRLGRGEEAFLLIEEAAKQLPTTGEAAARLALERAGNLSTDGRLAEAAAEALNGLDHLDGILPWRLSCCCCWPTSRPTWAGWRTPSATAWRLRAFTPGR